MITELETYALEELREEYNYKSKDIAKYLNVSTSTYSEWENNKVTIPTKRLLQLTLIYKINVDYILRLSKKKKINNNDNIDLILIGKRLKEARNSLNMSLRE